MMISLLSNQICVWLVWAALLTPVELEHKQEHGAEKKRLLTMEPQPQRQTQIQLETSSKRNRKNQPALLA